MYKVEVLSKFPVVQHFRFGSLFSWERQPNQGLPAASVDTKKQLFKGQIGSFGTNTVSTTPRDPSHEAPTPAPAGEIPTGNHVHDSSKVSVPGLPRELNKSNQPGYSNEVTKAPWATRLPAIPVPTVNTTPPWVHRQPLTEVPPTSAITTRSAEDIVNEASRLARHKQAKGHSAIGSIDPPPQVP